MQKVYCKMEIVLDSKGGGSVKQLMCNNWRIMVMELLYMQKSMGYNEIQRACALNPKILTETLKWLVEKGYINRMQYGRSVDYEITDFGKSVLGASCPLISKGPEL